MSLNVLRHFTFNYKEIVLDEIALQGLEGISLDYLWKRVEVRLSVPVTEKLKLRFWDIIINCKSISYYLLPAPVPVIDVFDRFTVVDDDIGHVKDPDYYLDGPYEYHPVENEYGSCKDFETRVLIPTSTLKTKSYEDIASDYGNKMVIVASFEDRWHALAGHMPLNCITQLSSLHYCILELVGRSRENGQTTTGNTNLLKIVKEPKLLYYNRKALQDLNLIKVQYISQVVGVRGVKSLLLRLKKFHQPSIQSLPKVGLLRNLADYLYNQPEQSETTDNLIKKGFITQAQCKRLNKTVNVFSFDERLAPPETPKGKSKKSKAVKRRYLTLTAMSDESSQSEDERTEEPIKCQYKIGVNLIIQAYERLLDAGMRGLSQIELTEMLGMEFYTGRTICRMLKSSNVVREYLEDKGKQRMARYVAIAAKDVQYAEEKKKFMNYVNDVSQDTEEPSTSAATNDAQALTPKVATEHGNTNNDFAIDITSEAIKNAVIEIKMLEGFERLYNKSFVNSGKDLTLRQLRFANGLLKVVNDNLLVPGFQTLSNLVAKEVNEPPLDAKALKSFLQKLMTDKQLKVIKMKWPGGKQRFTVFTCAYHIKITDPIVKAKYKEITLKALSTHKPDKKREFVKNVVNPLSHVTYPRYMKLRKLHEFLVKFAYFDAVKPESHGMREGIVSMIDVLPEVSIEFAIGNISTGSFDANLSKLPHEIFPVKIRDAPPEVRRSLLQTPSFHYNIKFNLRILAILGLIQLIQNPTQTGTYHNNSLSNFLFYVNRNAKIIDTTGRWPRPNVNLESLEKSFLFKTSDDVQEYWNSVYSISVATTVEAKDRECKKLYPPIRTEAEVDLYDNGERYGDGHGPCGFDRCFFMELPRLWYTFYLRAQKAKMMKKAHVKVPKPETTKKTKVKKVAPQVKRLVQKIKVPRRLTKSEPSVTWTEQEDNVIIMCKAAITIMSPSSQMGCLRVRNLAAKDILNLNDPKKVPALCHKRALTLESRTKVMYETERILNEMRRRRNLIQKYEGLLKKLRIRNVTNLTKFINEARVCMLELVWIINQVVRSKTYRDRIPCVAVNYEDFHQNFTIVCSTSNKPYNTYMVSEYPALKETVILTIMQTQNKPKNEPSKKVYATFKGYRENTLRIVMEQLRKSSAISAQEKLLYNRVNRLHLEDIAQNSYKLSVIYKRKWTCRLNAEFVDELAEYLNSKMPQSGIMGSPEINCILCEMQADGVLDVVSTTIPVITNSENNSLVQDEQLNVLDIETNYKLKSGTLGWKCLNNSNETKFANIIPGEPEDCLQTLTKNYVIYSETEPIPDIDMEDRIIAHLKCMPQGAMFHELQAISGYDTNALIQKLTDLENKNIVRRVGFQENVIVLIEHIKDWSIKLGDKTVIPTPWLTVDADIQYEVMFKWAGAVMNKIFECPGCSVSFISESCEFLTPRAVQDICMFLQSYGCVKLQTIRASEVDLFSDDDSEPDITDFNPYESVNNIIVLPFETSLTKYAQLRKSILDKYVRRF